MAPRTYDADRAMDRALDLFWERGYEAVSVEDLVRVTGMNRFGLYRRWGDKRGLLLACLARYAALMLEGPLASLTGGALADPRVDVVEGDVTDSLRAAASGAIARFDAVALDLFVGPRGTRAEQDHPLWGDAALALARDALSPGGALGVWCEESAPGFVKRLARAGLTAQMRRSGRGGRRHCVYLARRIHQVRGRNGRIAGRGGAEGPGHR